MDIQQENMVKWDKLPLRRRRIIITIVAAIMTVALLGMVVWNLLQERAINEYRRHLEGIYEKNINELVDSMQNMETRLGKLGVSTTPQLNAVMLTEIWRQADVTQENLIQLPGSLGPMNETLTFVNRCGDFCAQLERRIINGEEFTEEDRAQVAQLQQQCKQLNEEINGLRQYFLSGMLTWEEVWANEALDAEKYREVNASLERMESNSISYPSLIYDGPFSESHFKQEAKGTTGDMVTMEQAQAYARICLEDENVTLSYEADAEGVIPCYLFAYRRENGDTGNVYITKTGGWLLRILGTGATQGQGGNTQEETLKENGRVYLEKCGYPGMAPTYVQRYSDAVVINYVFEQDGVTLYPDLIKVKLSMEDGAVISVDAQNYLMSHGQRELAQPMVTQEDAQDKAGQRMEVSGARLCLIPMDNDSEKLCWEISGTKGENMYLVYVSAEDGKEVMILQILDSEDGTLVV